MNNSKNESFYGLYKENLLQYPLLKLLLNNSVYSIILINIIVICIVLSYKFSNTIILYFFLYQIYSIAILYVLKSYKENTLLLLLIIIIFICFFTFILYIIYIFTKKSKIIIIKNITPYKYNSRKAKIFSLTNQYTIYDENNISYHLEYLYLPTLIRIQKINPSIISSLKNNDKVRVTYYGFLDNDILNIEKI